ncbi:MAG: hypothetical protein IKZ29_02840 [Clostridiales bacterium]|nr:hypothetical protein [Clostridiales bacterium]
MAEELKDNMQPEISNAPEAPAEAVVEAAVAAPAAAATTVVAAAEAVAEKKAEEAKVAEEAAKAAKKAEEQAAKDAEKARIAAEKEAEKAKKAAEKEAEKQRIAQEKAAAKAEKKRQKMEAEQALINACPPQYKPVSTSKYFWFGFLSFLPCIGLIFTIICSFAGRNRNVKRFERAILAYYIIGIILCLIAVIVIGLILPPDTREGILYALDEILYSVGL